MNRKFFSKNLFKVPIKKHNLKSKFRAIRILDTLTYLGQPFSVSVGLSKMNVFLLIRSLPFNWIACFNLIQNKIQKFIINTFILIKPDRHHYNSGDYHLFTIIFEASLSFFHDCLHTLFPHDSFFFIRYHSLW